MPLDSNEDNAHTKQAITWILKRTIVIYNLPGMAN